MNLKKIWDKAPKEATHYQSALDESMNDVYFRFEGGKVVRVWVEVGITDYLIGQQEGDFDTWTYPNSDCDEPNYDEEALIAREDYRPDNSSHYQTEGLQTISILLEILDSRLGYVGGPLHASIWNEDCERALKKATKQLCKLYHAVGMWE